MSLKSKFREGLLLNTGGEAFLKTFKRRGPIVQRPQVESDDGRRVIKVGDRGSEAQVRNERPQFLKLIKEVIYDAKLTPDELASTLNILCKDMLPTHMFCKVRQLGR